MKALLQRVSRASVTVSSECVGEIEQGLLVLLGLDRGDDRAVADRMVDKLLAYRLFADGQGRMNCSVVDVHGGVLLVSQFTLSADTGRGLRPSFSSTIISCRDCSIVTRWWRLVSLARICKSAWSMRDQ
jgi:D-aminoacyl-tRNA deacylase